MQRLLFKFAIINNEKKTIVQRTFYCQKISPPNFIIFIVNQGLREHFSEILFNKIPKDI